MKYVYVLICLLVSANFLQAESRRRDKEVLMISYFKSNGQDGLHLAYSEDGYSWTALKNDASFLAPEVGDKIMRDPSICQGPDGTFHMVWTSSWWNNGIGVSHSKDLITWTPQKFIPVMAHEKKVKNTWAPEIFYDSATRNYMIYWASTIPGKFPETAKSAEKGLNHRMYYVTTKNFKTYSPTKLLYDGGFNAIDAFVIKEKNRYIMFVKDESRYPETQKNIRIATSRKVTGPYTKAAAPISENWVEGPSVVKFNGKWMLYFDAYKRHRYELIESTDLKTWTIKTDQTSFPKGIRHGTVFKVSRKVLDNLLKKTK